ncbi:hypothetical protein SAMN06298215_0385 [Bacteroidales bacterium WCE2008]|nr:hypothetical protein SAMN06298215_0385 [Bacteroidales bacterium WCE2008]
MKHFVLILAICLTVSCQCNSVPRQSSRDTVAAKKVEKEFTLPEDFLNGVKVLPDDAFSTEEKILAIKGDELSDDILNGLANSKNRNLLPLIFVARYPRRVDESLYLVGKYEVVDSVDSFVLVSRYKYEDNCDVNVYMVTSKNGRLIDAIYMANASKDYATGFGGPLGATTCERTMPNYFLITIPPHTTDVIVEDSDYEEELQKITHTRFSIGEDGEITSKHLNY